jgi:hypothetical protein
MKTNFIMMNHIQMLAMIQIVSTGKRKIVTTMKILVQWIQQF